MLKIIATRNVSPLLFPLLFGMIGAIIIFLFVSAIEEKPKTFATVNITQLVDEFIKEKRHKKVSSEIIKLETKEFGETLEATLQQVAKENYLILLPKEAVIAGVPDVTSIVRNTIEKRH